MATKKTTSKPKVSAGSTTTKTAKPKSVATSKPVKSAATVKANKSAASAKPKQQVAKTKTNAKKSSAKTDTSTPIKVPSIELVDVLDDLGGNLNRIFNSPEAINYLNKSEEFRSIVAKLAIIYKNGDESRSLYCKKLLELHPATQFPELKPNTDAGDIKDESAYLNLFFLNTFKKSIDKLDTLNKTGVVEPSLGATNEGVNNNAFTNQNDAKYFNNLRGRMAEMQGMLPPNPLSDPTFYPFQTKPKIVPLLKLVIAVLALVTFAILIINIVMYSQFASVIQVGAVDDKGSRADLGLNEMIPKVIGALGLLFLGWKFLFTDVKVERIKYTVNFSMHLILITLIFVFYMLFNVAASSNRSILKQFYPWEEEFGSGIYNKGGALYNTWFITEIVWIVLTGLIVIGSIVVWKVFNPKIDEEKVQRAFKEYQEEVARVLSSSSSNSSSGEAVG